MSGLPIRKMKIKMPVEAVRLLLNGATQYRYIMEPQPSDAGEFISFYVHDRGEFHVCDFRKGDIIGIREPYREKEGGGYEYRADGLEGKFKPSFHMPPEAIRLYIRVTGFYAQRINKITLAEIRKSGLRSKEEFREYWKQHTKFQARTLKEKGIRHTFDSGAWVWVLEYERTEKPPG